MSQRASCWSVTINNPTKTDEYNIAEGRQKGWKVEGQLEQGESGTPHYQLIVHTPQIRFSALKKVFPRAHIEVARNTSALAAYVQKADTRLASLSVSQDKYPSQLQIFQWYSLYYYSVKNNGDNLTNLQVFDLMISQKIRQGFYLGAEVMNPQIRSYIKKFGADIAYRERNISLDRQTDRQANLFSVSRSINENDEEENASLQEEGIDEEENWSQEATGEAY